MVTVLRPTVLILSVSTRCESYMKSISRLISAVLVILASATASAGNGSWSNVTITAIYDYSGQGAPANIVLLVLSASSTNSASCASNKTDVVIDLSTTGGQRAAATAHFAFASADTIEVDGAGSCGFYSGIETLADIRAN